MNQYFIVYDPRRKVLMFIRTDRSMNSSALRKQISEGKTVSRGALQIWGMNKSKYTYAMTVVLED